MKKTLLEKRMARKADKENKGQTPIQEAKELMDSLTVEMFVDIEELESSLIEFGSIAYYPKNLKLRNDNVRLQALRELSLPAGDEAMQPHPDTIVTLRADGDFLRFVDIMPSFDYVDREMREYLRKRGIGMRYIDRNVDWYKLDFYVKGES